MAMSRIPLQAIISDGALTKHLLDKANPLIGLSLKIWKQTQKLCNIQKTAKLLKWCSFDSDFPRNLSDERFKTWEKIGLTAYFNLIRKGSLKNFQTKREEYGLEQQEFYRFLQMRHCFDTLKKDIDMSNLESGMMKIFISAYNSECNTKTISKIYNCFSHRKSQESLYIKEKWDSETNDVSQDDCYGICQTQWKTTSSLSWREFCWKNLVRFFITPQQKRHYTTDSDCWRQCQTDNANHYHIFLSCPVPYWKSVHQILQEVFRNNIPFRFDSLYLGNLPQRINAKDKKLMSILLAAC